MVLTPPIRTAFWLRLSLVNLLLVAVMGVLMRYKICFEFPMLDQKQLQLAHSNFAFGGWVTQTLMVLIIAYLHQRLPAVNSRVYLTLLRMNAVAAYGTALAFVFTGYGLYSIVLLVCTILIGLGFTVRCLLDLRGVKDASANWFRAALLFMTISTAGTFSLAWMVLNKHIDQHTYLASIYWYLHFQYNGWFFFACVGLVLHALKVNESPALRVVFYLFGMGCVVSYLLSVLWLNMAIGWVLVAAAGAALQLWAWIRWVRLVKEPLVDLWINKPPLLRVVCYVLGLAVTVKLVLQLVSTIPQVSNLAFGYRPVVIAYLHLVLLAIISVCLLVLIWLTGVLRFDNRTTVVLGILVALIYINQLVLGVQGIASFANIVIHYLNECLLAIAILLAVAAGAVVRQMKVETRSGAVPAKSHL